MLLPNLIRGHLGKYPRCHMDSLQETEMDRQGVGIKAPEGVRQQTEKGATTGKWARYRRT